MKTGIELITEERKEQIEKHDRSIEDDFKYNTENQLPLAAMMLIEGSTLSNVPEAPSGWDDNTWEKMIRKGYKDRLVIAGALIAAEIDRISYVDPKEEE